MGKQLFKGSILFGPLPAVLVSTLSAEGVPNIFTAAWAGVACTNPPIVTLAVRKERLSYENIMATKAFTINLTTKEMTKMVDFCGCRSGRKVDKIKHFGIQLDPGVEIPVPSMSASPVALECKVISVQELGTHDLFLAEVVKNKVDESIIDENGTIQLGKTNLLAYSHGEYYGLNSKPQGTFGYSVAGKSVKKAWAEKRKKGRGIR